MDLLLCYHVTLHLVEVANFENPAPEGIGSGCECLSECGCAEVEVHALNIQ